MINFLETQTKQPSPRQQHPASGKLKTKAEPPQYVFTVQAYFYGERGLHSYIVGIYSTAEVAKHVADLEEQCNSDYFCEVLRWPVLDEPEREIIPANYVIRPLKLHPFHKSYLPE